MKKRTWADVDGKIPDCTLGRLMDSVEDETGRMPDWDEELPEDIDDMIPA